MKRIGIIGGLGPESTISCYREITRGYYRLSRDYGYPETIIYSVSFREFIEAGYDLPERVSGVLARLAGAGADFAIAPCNSVHVVYDSVAPLSPIPWLSITGPVAERAARIGIGKLALLGTTFTMKSDFYQRALARAGIETVLPSPAEQETVNRIIYDELVKCEVRVASRDRVLRIIDRLAGEGAGGVVLACTELPFLVRPRDTSLEVLDTTALQARQALEYALNGPGSR